MNKSGIESSRLPKGVSLCYFWRKESSSSPSSKSFSTPFPAEKVQAISEEERGIAMAKVHNGLSSGH